MKASNFTVRMFSFLILLEIGFILGDIISLCTPIQLAGSFEGLKGALVFWAILYALQSMVNKQLNWLVLAGGLGGLAFYVMGIDIVTHSQLALIALVADGAGLYFMCSALETEKALLAKSRQPLNK